MYWGSAKSSRSEHQAIKSQVKMRLAEMLRYFVLSSRSRISSTQWNCNSIWQNLPRLGIEASSVGIVPVNELSYSQSLSGIMRRKWQCESKRKTRSRELRLSWTKTFDENQKQWRSIPSARTEFLPSLSNWPSWVGIVPERSFPGNLKNSTIIGEWRQQSDEIK